MRAFAKFAFVWIAIVCVGLAGAELALRLFAPLPVPGGVYLDRDGNSVRVAQDEFVLRPSIEVTHTAPEFKAIIRTNSLGYRRTGNESATPDVVFLGDSFTFGHGVADDQVFASIYCTRNRLTCQNLGRSGTNTFDQVRVLRHALDARAMRPKAAILVMLAACWIESAGNDLGENYIELLNRDRRGAPVVPPAPQPRTGLVKELQILLGNLEIVKRMNLLLSVQIKHGVYRCSGDGEIAAAVRATGVALNELDELSGQYDFKVKVFVIHPFQELNGFHDKTEAYLRGVMPKSFEFFSTARDFQLKHYYRYDGHFNAAGHANLAAIVERSLTPR